jgi:hypothetical protein
MLLLHPPGRTPGYSTTWGLPSFELECTWTLGGGIVPTVQIRTLGTVGTLGLFPLENNYNGNRIVFCPLELPSPLTELFAGNRYTYMYVALTLISSFYRINQMVSYHVYPISAGIFASVKYHLWKSSNPRAEHAGIDLDSPRIHF